jgi:hypothetical protein
MVKDYGAQRTERWSFVTLALVVCGCVGAAGVVTAWLEMRTQRFAEAKSWTVEGPPCPSLSRAAIVAFGAVTWQTFDYDGFVIARIHGDATCSEIGYDGGRSLFGDFPVCQFERPGLLVIRTRQGIFRYAPGVGRPATISVPHGRPRCVVAATADFE